MDVPIPLARLDLEKQDSDEPAIETSTSIQDEARGPEAEPQSVQHSLQSRDPVQDGDDNEARIEFTDDNEAEPDRQASIRDVLREEHSQQAASGSTKAAIRSHRNFPDPSYPSFTLPIARRRKREPGIEYIDWQEEDRQNPFNWRKRRKRILLVVGFFFALATIMNASSYTMAEKGATSDFGASGLTYTSGTTTFLAAVAFAPMVLAPISEGEVGSVYLAIGLGGLVGYVGNFLQERIYDAETRSCHGKAAPEVRLYLAASVGAFLFPASLFFFAWTARPWISPAAPIVALVLLSASIYWIQVSVISYIADCFERYTSSGLAAEYFTRVLLAAFFPLFLSKMYENLGPPIASSVLGSIAAVLSLCPFLLIRFGEKLRRKSRIVRQLEQDEFDLMNKDLELSG